LKKLDVIEKYISKLDSLEEMLLTIVKSKESEEILLQKLGPIQDRVQAISDCVCTNVGKHEFSASNSGSSTDLSIQHLDRKRLKEKLKEAMEQKNETSVSKLVQKSIGWAEYIFGICKPNGRLGKEGSRFLSFWRLLVV
jgi:hypothetical protein